MILVDIFNGFLHWTGSDNVSGPQYGFWSGFGSDLTEFGGLLTLVVTMIRNHRKQMHQRERHHQELLKVHGGLKNVSSKGN